MTEQSPVQARVEVTCWDDLIVLAKQEAVLMRHDADKADAIVESFIALRDAGVPFRVTPDQTGRGE